MTRKTRKRLILVAIGLGVVTLVVYGFLPEPVPVDVETVQRGTLQVIVEEEGETQLDRSYMISSPVAAIARRIELEPGDYVARGQPVVYLEPPRAVMLDARSHAHARAAVTAAQAAVEQAERQTEAAEAAMQQAEAERRRIAHLVEGGSATEQALEQARTTATQARANLDAAQAAVVAARAELASARVALAEETGDAAELPVRNVLRAPVSGRVLAVHHKSAGQVNPGAPLVEVGDTDRLEVRVDVLSQDAVRIKPGTPLLLDQWGGDEVLAAVVERVEPQGFTEVSSLGVEEKRVSVIATLTSPPGMWPGLGAGYRVLARFIVWEGDDVLIVPASALFNTETGWAVFAVEDGHAALRPVRVGQQTGLAAQILSGLEEGEAVIVHPENSITEGTAVAPRNQ